MTWTDDKITAVRNLIAEGLSMRQIAVAIGATKNAVVGIAHRRGLVAARKGRPSPPPAPAIERLPAPKLTPLTRLATFNPYPPIEHQPAPRGPAPWRLEGLKPRECRFPVAERNGRHLFCGAPVDGLRPYCTEHRAGLTLPRSHPHYRIDKIDEP